METIVGTQHNVYDNLVNLREKVTSLVTQSEDEVLLADIVAMLSGKKFPCTYSKNEFESVLAESDEDYKLGKLISHEQLFAKYGL